jgi:Ferric reductase like transmembrane component
MNLAAQATDGSGWSLQASLTLPPQQRVRRGTGTAQVASQAAGMFTLSNPNASTVTGTVAGTVDRSGAGNVQLTSDDGTTSLSSTFTVAANNALTLSLDGQLPAVTVDNGNHAFWYLSRASALTAYLLLTLSVCLGLLVRTRIMDWLLARWRWFDLHQFTALTALAFALLHVFSLLGDHYIGYSLKQLLIPFSSPYRALPVSAGVISLYLLVVVIASFWLRRFIGYRAWRALHFATFALFLLALLHGLFAGTDTGQIWSTALYWGSGMLVGALTIWRFTSVRNRADPAANPRPAAPARRLEAV